MEPSLNQFPFHPTVFVCYLPASNSSMELLRKNKIDDADVAMSCNSMTSYDIKGQGHNVDMLMFVCVISVYNSQVVHHCPSHSHSLLFPIALCLLSCPSYFSLSLLLLSSPHSLRLFSCLPTFLLNSSLPSLLK